MLTFVDDKERKEILAYFLERFGIPERVFDAFQLMRSGKVIRVISELPGLREAMGLNMAGVLGIPLLRTKRPVWKPTTVGIQLFGYEATRNCLDLDDARVRLVLRGEPLREDLAFTNGYLILKWAGHVLGCGFYENGILESQIPGEWRGVEWRSADAIPLSNSMRPTFRYNGEE